MRDGSSIHQIFKNRDDILSSCMMKYQILLSFSEPCHWFNVFSLENELRLWWPTLPWKDNFKQRTQPAPVANSVSYSISKCPIKNTQTNEESKKKEYKINYNKIQLNKNHASILLKMKFMSPDLKTFHTKFLKFMILFSFFLFCVVFFFENDRVLK